MGPEDIVISDVGRTKCGLRGIIIRSPQYLPDFQWLRCDGHCNSRALAAKLVYPERKVVAATGDGGFMMNCQERLCALERPLSP